MLGGLTRPVGPVKIRKTELVCPDVMVAKLSGAVRADVATVRHGRRYFMVAPERLGGTQEIPADNLTDCLHAGVWRLNQTGRRKRK
jgi:hypothetical protein